MTNGSVMVDRFGPDLPNLGSSDPAQTLFTFDFLQENFHEGFLYNFTSYRWPTFRSNLAIYPGTYALNGWTYGYVQENVATLGDLGNVYVAVPWIGHTADVNLKLIVGVNLTISMVFRTEDVISGIPYNVSIRIRVFDDSDRLVAASTLTADAGSLNPSSNSGYFANGKKIVNEAVPAGTKVLTYIDLAGAFSYVEPSSPNSALRSATLFSSDHGIWGSSSLPGAYSGAWTVMVDIVNWCRSTSFYPPVPALLQGESPYFFPYDHLGPYSQNGFTRISNAPQGGEASAAFGLDLRGYVKGTVLALNWDGDPRTTSLATLQIVNNSSYQYYWYTWDGWFDGYLDPGTYQVTITEWRSNEGHLPVSFVLEVTPGQQSESLNFILVESQIPIPEFSAIPLSIILTLIMAGEFLKFSRRKR